MWRYALSIALLVAACGQDTGSSPSSPADQAAKPETTPGVGAAMEAAGVDPAVTQCLDLVRQAKFEAAVAACTRAVEANPKSAEAQAALEQARRGETAQETVSDAQAEAAAELDRAREERLQGIPKPQTVPR